MKNAHSGFDWLRRSLLPLVLLLGVLCLWSAGMVWLDGLSIIAARGRHQGLYERLMHERPALALWLTYLLPEGGKLALPAFLVMALVLARRRRVRLTPLMCVTLLVATPTALVSQALLGPTAFRLPWFGMSLEMWLTISPSLLIGALCALLVDARMPVVDERAV